MRALVLAAGRGKRLNEVTEDKNKCLIKVNGKELLRYSLDSAVELSMREIVIVVGYRAEDIINHFGNNYRGIPVKYAIQRDQMGLVHAMECASPFLRGDDFFLFLADEILVNDRRRDMLEFYRKEKVVAVCGMLRRSPDKQSLIKRTYGVICADDLRLFRLVEKPRKVLNPWQGTGNCIMSADMLDYIDVCPIHHERKEKELPDLIQCAIDDGNYVYGFDLCDDYVNINSHDDIEYTNIVVRG